MEIISWKQGTQFPVEAKVAADTIRDLQKKLGRDCVTAKELLDTSRSEDAPLHSCFEWNDTIAAEEYRIYQARHLIGAIVVSVTDVTQPPVRLFVNVKPVAPKSTGEFATINVVMDNPNYRKQVLHNALTELRAFQRKYSTYQELAGVSKAIDAFGDAIK